MMFFLTSYRLPYFDTTPITRPPPLFSTTHGNLQRHAPLRFHFFLEFAELLHLSEERVLLVLKRIDALGDFQFRVITENNVQCDVGEEVRIILLLAFIINLVDITSKLVLPSITFLISLNSERFFEMSNALSTRACLSITTLTIILSLSII